MAEDVLKLALPVMLHKEKEVAAYKEAKPRIETYMNEEVQIPTEVGMFCYMLPFAIRKPENRKTQLEVQKKERFSIYHVQAPVTGVHSLDLYGQSAIEANDMGSLLKTAVEHTAQLAEYSKTRPEFDVHQGIY